MERLFYPKPYLFSLTFVLSLSFTFLVLSLLKVNPQSAALTEFTWFYVSFFFLALSGFSIFGYSLRVFTSKNPPLRLFAKTSFRQGLLLSFLLVIILFLQSLRSLSLLSVLLLTISLTLLEIAFLTR